MDVRILVRRVLLGWLILVLIVALFGKISVAETNNGQTAADFLLIGSGARAAGMGGAFTAVAEGVSTMYFNPAGLTEIDGGEVLLSHFAWYQDMSLEYGVFGYRLSDVTTAAVSITYFNYGTIQGYDFDGNPTDEIPAFDLAASVSFAYRASDRLSLGLTGKYVVQKIDDISGSTPAFDIGAMYGLGRFNLAAALSNIGPMVTFDGVSERLPAAGRLGLSVYPVEERLLASVELEKRYHGLTVFRQGFEYNFNEQYYLRAGYNYIPADDQRSLGTGVTFGAGLRFSTAEFDYAYTIEEKYSGEGIHRFTAVMRFGP